MDHVCGLREFEDYVLHAADAGAARAPDRLVFDEIWPGARAQMAEAGYPVPPLGFRAASHLGFDPRAVTAPLQSRVSKDDWNPRTTGGVAYEFLQDASCRAMGVRLRLLQGVAVQTEEHLSSNSGAPRWA